MTSQDQEDGLFNYIIEPIGNLNNIFIMLAYVFIVLIVFQIIQYLMRKLIKEFKKLFESYDKMIKQLQQQLEQQQKICQNNQQKILNDEQQKQIKDFLEVTLKEKLSSINCSQNNTFQDEIQKINQTISEQQHKIEQNYQQIQDEMKEKGQKLFQEEIKQLKNQFSEQNQQSQEEIKKLNDQFSEQIEEIKKLNDQLSKLNSEINGMKEEIKKLNNKFNNQNLEISKINGIEENIRQWNDQLSQYNLEINGIEEKIRQMNDKFNNQNLEINKIFGMEQELQIQRSDIQKLITQNVNKNEIDNQNKQDMLQVQSMLQAEILKLNNEVQDLKKIKEFNIQSEFQRIEQKIENIDLEQQNLIKKSSLILPSPPKPPQDVINFGDTIISSLYNKTCRQRFVEPLYRLFVSDILSTADLIQEYGMNKLEIKTQLKQFLGGMRRSRGDGNCFYTSFVFQYLDFMINMTKKEQFQELIQLIQRLPFEIFFEDEQYNQNDFDNLKEKFIKICQQLRQQKKMDRQKLFCEYFKDEQNEFYGLSIVFLRNLAFKYCSENEQVSSIFQAQGLNLQQELLQWEFDCQSNEAIIKLLSENLNIHTIQFAFAPKEQTLKILQYNECPDPMLKIYLLFRPGHYNIGVPKQK
ncbi:unnamed protein product [Paramecium pentaurelia]|uniref:Uncharacterized protein n=1 Tax=Paramecium pentaurelia TaxID=43138 RepID=A0A8S1SLW7_9CILI|nr:unnamed protein product [Paramecium pentaurelia]